MMKRSLSLGGSVSTTGRASVCCRSIPKEIYTVGGDDDSAKSEEAAPHVPIGQHRDHPQIEDNSNGKHRRPHFGQEEGIASTVEELE